jgi:type I restriction enzyme M protein
MLSPQLRKKVHSLWSLFWAAGISNPLAAIEQITYLLFIRELEGLDRQRVDAGKESIFGRGPDLKKITKGEYQHCRWSYIRRVPSFELLNGTVFPWLRWLEKGLADDAVNNGGTLSQVTGRLADAYFILDTNKTDTLKLAIGHIDDLFKQLDTRSANADIMGDIFEHLLEEVKESGKNGQFRTPRQIIRFMVELLDPAPGARVMDPACGSAGFLINTLLHWRASHTDTESLKLEWDGAPHNLLPVWPQGQAPDLDQSLHGYDNDRTMVRIAWMNLLLHGLEAPNIAQRDSLSKRMTDEESGGYDHVLANPPFTGSVDEADLSENRERVPYERNKPITTKSELLYVWLILDLLRIGGRAAVIVPDGVLFGNTKAHRALRRQLLFENTLEAVVSLPPNVFQPYSGVKTSILVFQKAQTPETKPAKGDEPRTREVWFYEVMEEAYSLDQKRKPRFGQDNDLFDALEKYRAWRAYLDGQIDDGADSRLTERREAATGGDYWQPDYWEERWRVVDDAFLKVFPDKDADKGKPWALHELWPGLPRDPREAEAAVVAEQGPRLENCFERHCADNLRSAYAGGNRTQRLTIKLDAEKRREHTDRAARDLANRINRLIRDEGLLDREFDQYGFNALKPLIDAARQQAAAGTAEEVDLVGAEDAAVPVIEAAIPELRAIVSEFAKLDGYNVWRRGNESVRYEGKRIVDEDGEASRAAAPQSWVVPVRVWARRETWGTDPETGDEIATPTHDGAGLVRLDYLDWLKDSAQVFDDDGTILKEHLGRLEPECLEALDFNLSAGRHKPFLFDAGMHRPPAELIKELDSIHGQIRERLGRLLALVEGVA